MSSLSWDCSCDCDWKLTLERKSRKVLPRSCFARYGSNELDTRIRQRSNGSKKPEHRHTSINRSLTDIGISETDVYRHESKYMREAVGCIIFSAYSFLLPVHGIKVDDNPHLTTPTRHVMVGITRSNLGYTRLRRISKSSPFSAHLRQTVLGVKHDDYACHLFGKLDSFIKIDERIPWVIQRNMLYPVGGACLRKIGSGGFRMFNCSNATNHFAAAMGLVIGSALC